MTIQNFGALEITNEEGYVWLNAPEDRDRITIISQKEGYYRATAPLGINIDNEGIIKNTDIFVFVAIIALISAIIFVNIRQRRNLGKREGKKTEKQIFKKYGSHGAIVSYLSDEKTKESTRYESKRESKIEEIRISRPRKDKKIIPINQKEEEERKIIPVRSNTKSDWFEGKEDIRYEIDRLTGEIDEENLDKWFEGIDDIRAKIDEKVKKKDKKNEIEDN
ncbi:MAG: hypothetical protein JSW62_00685 [Thermoplasmatales archaeon]|nr:MAG: hypothetical protein JSW62_00685 [Thermoplasmatales archaeon]